MPKIPLFKAVEALLPVTKLEDFLKNTSAGKNVVSSKFSTPFF